MASEYLNKITTQWTLMEGIIEKEGPRALSEFLVAKYFSSLTLWLKTKHAKMDDDEAHDQASAVIYELIKNDYRGIKRLNRDRGHLRGLFMTIMKRTIMQSEKTNKILLLAPEDLSASHKTDTWIDIYLDFQTIVAKMQEQRPLLYQPFILHYLEGKSLAEISDILQLQTNAIKQRLYSARRWLAENLEEYKI